MKLEKRIAVVTGAGRGIGLRIATHLAQEGAGVVFNDVQTREAATESVRVINQGGGRAIFHQADISHNSDIKGLVERTVQQFGRIDILVNNAAIDPRVPFLDMEEDLWRRVVDTNLKGTYFCAQAAAQCMRETGGGRIINISSVHSQATMLGFSAYAASKGAVNTLTRQLALELAQYKITVNAIAPGAIEVERFNQDPIYDRVALGSEIPLGRVGIPDDISSAVIFLASEETAWLTGQVIIIDGGTLTRLYLYAGRPIPPG